ncbi:MAG TPA: S41 family peptidase [Rhizomicrobium sp.]|nr:S41 family peptidase [Rhizomicrobium sp.]
MITPAVLRSTAIAAALLLCAAAPDPATPLTPAQEHAAVDTAEKLIAKNYVLEDKRAVVAELRRREAAGRYAISNPAQFAQTLSDDLVEITQDRHMWFAYDPAGYRAALLPHDENHGDPLSAAAFARNNQGYEEMRILPGNIRYVNFTGFEWSGAPTASVIADVARFLHGGDAIVLDIGGNGGGAPEAVQALVSYFLPPDGRVLMTFHDGRSGKTNATHVLAALAGPRLTGIPLYVLISGNTGSAAEEFATHTRYFKLGTLVGSTTAGAANNNDVFPIAPYFLQSISYGRPVHPVSGTNWERVGVAPDIVAPRPLALATAEVAALTGLMANAAPERRAQYAWALVAAQAQLTPLKLDAEALGAYAGQYGVRKIWLEDGVLAYRREGREATPLTPLAPDLFALAGNADQRVQFRRAGGRVVGFDLTTADGARIPVDRSP